MQVRDYLKNNILYLDGGMGTLLQDKGVIKAGELPERLNITDAPTIQSIHKGYYDAGSNIVSTNTFGANVLKFSEEELEEIVKRGVQNAQIAKEQSSGTQHKWVALDIGPTGKMLAPYGDLDFEEAVSIFAKTIRLGVQYGVDLIFIETMNDSYETKAAVLAAKENCDLPIFVSNAYGEDGLLMTGANPQAMVALLEGLGVDAIGVNCSFGPKKLMVVVDEYLQYASIPVLLKPNAGLPKVENGKTSYDCSAEEFSSEVFAAVQKGVRIVGGCCGTTPTYIERVRKCLKEEAPKPISLKNHTVVSSYTHAVVFGEKPILIGERINPTGKKKFKEALKNNDYGYILTEGVNQQDKGADILDVNVGLPEIDEEQTLKTIVCQLQAIVDLPLQIDTSNLSAMESALRRYNGKGMVNSVNGKKESMEAVFPLVKKYGGVVVCLTLDENGIPEKAEDRLEIACKILSKARDYGIDKKDLIFDPLTLTVSAEKDSAIQTLKAVKLIGEKLGCHTILGVSNVSFGLPQREIINAAFFTMALNQGLSAAIINPYSVEMMKAHHAFCVLNGVDDQCKAYVDFVENLPTQTLSVAVEKTATVGNEAEYKSELQNAIIKGLKEQTIALTDKQLETVPPMDVVQNEIIPALNRVGIGFEEKRVYLPQLLMSAEASKAAFERVKDKMQGGQISNKCGFVIATVKGDIHDIGKNIVKLLLENYGFTVYDLGRDVPPEKILEKTIETHAPIVGLSALMTTTVPAMEETIQLLQKRAPWCKIVVGGAVLNKEYAQRIGANAYAKDAMETVRYAEEINANL